MTGRTRRRYVKPGVIRIELDNTISLVMMTAAPPNPPGRGRGLDRKPETPARPNDPFSSPFSDKPFN